MGGKDRTGLVSALLLRLAGVGLETIGEDYSLSADNLAPLGEQWLADAADEAEREKRRRLAHTPAGGDGAASSRRSSAATAMSRRTCALPV